jgi:hypothetical protein
MKEPLGRIHPHGSGGKSVYQRAGQAHNSASGVVDFICYCVGYGLLGICGIGLLGLLASGGGEIGGAGLMLMGFAVALINS